MTLGGAEINGVVAILKVRQYPPAGMHDARNQMRAVAGMQPAAGGMVGRTKPGGEFVQRFVPAYSLPFGIDAIPFSGLVRRKGLVTWLGS